jgi:porphobilinogen deaminase
MSRPRLAGSLQPTPAHINQTVLTVQTRDADEALQAAEDWVERLRTRDKARAERATERHADLSKKYDV